MLSTLARGATLVALLAHAVDCAAQPFAGTVTAKVKISETQGGLAHDLTPSGLFGNAVIPVGDLDGDGATDILVGGHLDNEFAPYAGAIYVLFLKPDGTVKKHQKITTTESGFTGVLHQADRFGYASANLGDLDGDGVVDVAVSSLLDSAGGFARGAVWILFLKPDGTVKHWTRISSEEGGLQGPLDDNDIFGTSCAALPDLNGDGVIELLVGAGGDDDGGEMRGAAYVLFLRKDGTVRGEWKISHTSGGFGPGLNDQDRFGQSAALLGDIDGDGALEVAFGAVGDDDGGSEAGAVWIATLAGSPWTWMGHAKAGSAGVPALAAHGTLTAGSGLVLELSQAAPSAPCLFVVSPKEGYHAFLGLTLVPGLPALIVPGMTDPFGAAKLPAIWPAAASALTFHAQCLVADGAATFGVAASNAVMGIAP